MLLRKKLVIIFASIVVLTVAVVASGASNRHVAHADGACGSRKDVQVYDFLRPYISRACYDTGTWSGAGVQLTLTTQGVWSCRTFPAWCQTFASFVVYNGQWRGNRPLWSVTREIFLHSSYFHTNPIHIEYKCSDLSWFEKPFYGC